MAHGGVFPSLEDETEKGSATVGDGQEAIRDYPRDNLIFSSQNQQNAEVVLRAVGRCYIFMFICPLQALRAYSLHSGCWDLYYCQFCLGTINIYLYIILGYDILEERTLTFSALPYSLQYRNSEGRNFFLCAINDR